MCRAGTARRVSGRGQEKGWGAAPEADAVPLAAETPGADDDGAREREQGGEGERGDRPDGHDPSVRMRGRSGGGVGEGEGVCAIEGVATGAPVEGGGPGRARERDR